MPTDDSAQPEQKPVRYRVRARAPDGQEVVGAPVEAGAAGDGLVNPRWAANELDHGAQGEMLVDAPGLDGRRVRFTVQRREGEDWTEVAQLLAKVAGGRARAIWRARHHLESATRDSPHTLLRFSAVLV